MEGTLKDNLVQLPWRAPTLDWVLRAPSSLTDVLGSLRSVQSLPQSRHNRGRGKGEKGCIALANTQEEEHGTGLSLCLWVPLVMCIWRGEQDKQPANCLAALESRAKGCLSQVPWWVQLSLSSWKCKGVAGGHCFVCAHPGLSSAQCHCLYLTAQLLLQSMI